MRCARHNEPDAPFTRRGARAEPFRDAHFYDNAEGLAPSYTPEPPRARPCRSALTS
jgi:hypothetical protein